eukprot:SAG31_NODE_6262_length_2097_cov_2.127628_2_plen_138_part_00
MCAAYAEIFTSAGPHTGRPLYHPPIEMTVETGRSTKFLETDILVLWDYHLVCVHRNPEADKILRGIAAPNYRITPYDMHTTDAARLEYISSMFTRVEHNSMFAAHIVMIILEMIVELRLHQWPFDVIFRVIRRRCAR